MISLGMTLLIRPQEGAMRSDLPSSDTMTLKAVKQMILEATLEKWQKAWDLSNTGKHMKEIETQQCPLQLSIHYHHQG